MLQDLITAAVNDGAPPGARHSRREDGARHRWPAPARSRLGSGGEPPEPVIRLIESFSRLPGVGPKTAQRLTYHLLERRTRRRARWPRRSSPCATRSCTATLLQHLDRPICSICLDGARDDSRLCVVEEPLDVLALERTSAFRGRYHVLHGAISPMDGIGPDRLRVRDCSIALPPALARRAVRRGRAGDQPDPRG